MRRDAERGRTVTDETRNETGRADVGLEARLQETAIPQARPPNGTGNTTICGVAAEGDEDDAQATACRTKHRQPDAPPLGGGAEARPEVRARRLLHGVPLGERG